MRASQDSIYSPALLGGSWGFLGVPKGSWGVPGWFSWGFLGVPGGSFLGVPGDRFEVDLNLIWARIEAEFVIY